MSFDIVVRFPSKDLADEFAAQMSDGFGEGFCDFSFWRKKEGTTGKNKDDFERVYLADGTPVYFVKRLFHD